jgi:hypothetical protein
LTRLTWTVKAFWNLPEGGDRPGSQSSANRWRDFEDPDAGFVTKRLGQFVRKQQNTMACQIADESFVVI